VGFEPAISDGERPQTYDLDSAANLTGGENEVVGQKQKQNSVTQKKPHNN
jgi:hypothetical protein